MTKLQVGRPTSSAIAAPGDRYAVSFHDRVLKTIAKVGIESSQFKPTIIELIESFEVDPKQYPLKRGKLAGCRAAKVRFADGISWRAVFRVFVDWDHGSFRKIVTRNIQVVSGRVVAVLNLEGLVLLRRIERQRLSLGARGTTTG